MSKEQKKEINWLLNVEAHDYPAAASYLCILFPEDRVCEMVTKLRATPLMQFKAKDIFRASLLSLLEVSNLHVEKNTEKIEKGIGLSPLLLVRDERNAKVIIAMAITACAPFTDSMRMPSSTARLFDPIFLFFRFCNSA